MFSCEFFEISKNTFFTKHLGTTASGVGEGPESVLPPKICHTYPTMMKLGTLIPYLKKIRKIHKSRDTRDTPLEFCWHQHFSSEISKFCFIKKYRYTLYFDTLFLILLIFFESLTIFLMNMTIMSTKMATPGLLKIKVFWNKDYGPITFVYDVINKNLSRDLNHVVGMVMWPKFGNSSTSMREVIIT